MANQKLKLVRAPHGYRNSVQTSKYEDSETGAIVIPVEHFLLPVITKHGSNSISGHQWRDAYWWAQQEAKRHLLMGTKQVVIVGEFPSHKLMMGFVKAARTYHAKLQIVTLAHPKLADEVPFDAGNDLYDRNSIVLSVHRFVSDYTIDELIDLSKQQDQKGRS